MQDDRQQHITGGEEAEKGVSTTAFAVVIALIIILIFLGAAYSVISDRLNGLDAYRTKALRDQRDGFKTACEENYRTTAILQEWMRRQTVQAPPELLVQKQCVQPVTIEEEDRK